MVLPSRGLCTQCAHTTLRIWQVAGDDVWHGAGEVWLEPQSQPGAADGSHDRAHAGGSPQRLCGAHGLPVGLWTRGMAAPQCIHGTDCSVARLSTVTVLRRIAWETAAPHISVESFCARLQASACGPSDALSAIEILRGTQAISPYALAMRLQCCASHPGGREELLHLPVHRVSLAERRSPRLA